MRPPKITFKDTRQMGVHGALIYCADYNCGHPVALSADGWPDELRLSDIEPRFVCSACGKRGADVRPDFDSRLRLEQPAHFGDGLPKYVTAVTARLLSDHDRHWTASFAFARVQRHCPRRSPLGLNYLGSKVL